MVTTSNQVLSHHGIGASEIAAIAGLNPYTSPWDVWARKTGQKSDEPTRFTEWGHRLEGVIRQAYADQTGMVVTVPGASIFRASPSWARATPDGFVFEPDKVAGRRDRIMQAKNVGSWVEKSWSEAPPAYVQLQEQWEMFVTDDVRADVAVLIGGNDFRIYTIHRDDKVINDLVDIAGEFWGRVERRVPPEIDDSDGCQQHFERRFAKSAAVELVADVEVEKVFARWHDLAIASKAYEIEIKRIRNTVRQHLAEAQAGRLVSTIGTAVLQGGGEKVVTETDFEAIARLLGSAKCTPEEWQALVAAHTKTTTATKAPTLFAPRNWSKEPIA